MTDRAHTRISSPLRGRIKVGGKVCFTPTPELCKVQGFVLHPTWCRASASPVKGEGLVWESLINKKGRVFFPRPFLGMDIFQ